jgi:hypothetical protein
VPTWAGIGQLAAIAAIRTTLNYFLERDIEAFKAKTEQADHAGAQNSWVAASQLTNMEDWRAS